MMQLTVFGASGKVGRQVVAVALAKEYEVVAFVHSHNPFADEARLRVVSGDVRDRAAVTAALAGSGAAISALGSWGTKEKDVLTTGMTAIIPAMQEIGVKRLVTLTGAGARWSGDTPGFVDRLSHGLLGVVASKILQDGEEHLRLLDGSGLEWTCLRSPVMREQGSDAYRLDMKSPTLWAGVPRAAVAQALVDQLGSFDYLRSAPFIHHT